MISLNYAKKSHIYYNTISENNIAEKKKFLKRRIYIAAAAQSAYGLVPISGFSLKSSIGLIKKEFPFMWNNLA